MWHADRGTALLSPRLRDPTSPAPRASTAEHQPGRADKCCFEFWFWVDLLLLFLLSRH